MVSDNEASADFTQDHDDGNATLSGEESEDKEQPKKSKKVQRGETREIIKEKRRAAAAEVVDDG
jgi:hypothetical protein